jgi:hypothetical protein
VNVRLKFGTDDADLYPAYRHFQSAPLFIATCLISGPR